MELKPKSKNFTIIDNDLIDDTRLNSNAFIILLYILREDDDVVPNAKHIAKALNISTSTYYRSLKKLEETGYLRRTKIQGGYHYEIFEKPINRRYFIKK